MGERGGGRRAASLAALASVALAASAAAAAPDSACQPWPGEPSPLPTVASGDAALERWAELRAAELVVRAQLAEDGDPRESHRLWRRVLCLDPASQVAWRGLDRTRVVRVYRPKVRWGRAVAAPVADPWQSLAAVIAVAPPAPAAPVRTARPATPPAPAPRPPAPSATALAARPPAPPPPRPSQRESQRQRERARADALEQVGNLLEQGEQSLQAARFQQALGRAEAARRGLAGLSSAADTRALSARTEVLAATAQVALGDDAAARASFERALAADPGLHLDPVLTSPKVLRALEAARGQDGT